MQFIHAAVLSVILIFYVSDLRAAKKKASCTSIFAGVIDQSTTRKFYVSDSVDKRFVGHGRVEKRVLKFSFDFKAFDGSRSQALRGAEQFANMVKHFQGQFDRVQGQWFENGFMKSDNLELLNTLTGPPNLLPIELAAQKTWTGKQAAIYGFTKVKKGKIEGVAGAYTSVSIYFEKP